MAKQWFKKSMAIKDAPGDFASRRPSVSGVLGLVGLVVLVVVVIALWGDDAPDNEPASAEPVASTAPDADASETTTNDKPDDAAEPAPAQANARDDTQDDVKAGEDKTAADETSDYGLHLEGALGLAISPDMAAALTRAAAKPEPESKPEPKPEPVSTPAATPPGPEVAQWCNALSERVGSVEREHCMDGSFVDTGHRSVNDRPMIIREIRATDQPAAGRVLLLGAVHGDEPSSIGTAFSWMQLMAEQGTSVNWHVVPTFNPDGVLETPATRVNANGVDLNRNLPTNGWARKSRDYWRRVGFEKRRFPGKAPASEPENKWLVKEIREYQPDVIVTLHAPYGVLDYDGDFPAPRKLGDLRLHRLGVYPGSLGNFGSRMQGIPVITVELDDARQPPSQSDTQRMWADLTNWLDRYMRSVRQARSDTASDAG